MLQLCVLLQSTSKRNNISDATQKVGLQLVNCFCNLETYLNLEFAAGKQSGQGRDSLSASQQSEDSQPFVTAHDFDDYDQSESKDLAIGSSECSPIKPVRPE